MTVSRRRLRVPWPCRGPDQGAWHDGVGLSLYAKRLDRGRFIWPATVDGMTAAQMGYLLEAIDWRNPKYSWRP
ncbi:IS66 family insertion sequence element accessory protein TnpB [Bradyrhizobium sp. USDA 3364]